MNTPAQTLAGWRPEQASSSNTNLRKNIFSLSLLQATNYLVPLITVPYLTRVLGPEHFGMLALAQAAVVYFDLITDYGFNLSATRRVAVVLEDPGALTRVFWSTLTTKVVLLMACALTGAAIVSVAPPLRRHADLYAAAFLTVVGTALFPVWLFQGARQTKYLTASLISARAVSIPVLLLLVRGPNGAVRAAMVQSAVPIIAALLIVPALWKRIGIRAYLPSPSDIRNSLFEGWHLFLSNSAVYLLSSTTVIILGLVAGSSAAGYYAAADKLIKAAGALVNPFTQALYPHLSSLRAQSEDAALRLIRKSLFWVGGVTLLAAVAAFTFAAPLADGLLGSRFAPSAVVLRSMSPLLVLIGLNNVLGTQTMMVFDLDAAVARISLRYLLLSVSLTVLLSLRWGAAGAALANVAGAAMTLTWMIGALKKAHLAIWRKPRETCVS